MNARYKRTRCGRAKRAHMGGGGWLLFIYPRGDGRKPKRLPPLVWARRGPIAARVLYGFSVPTARAGCVGPKRAPRARVRAGAVTATNGAERRSVAEKRPGRGEAPGAGRSERARHCPERSGGIERGGAGIGRDLRARNATGDMTARLATRWSAAELRRTWRGAPPCRTIYGLL